MELFNVHGSQVKTIMWDNLGVLGFIVGGSYPELMVRVLQVPLEDVIRVLTSPESELLDLGEMSKEEYFDYVVRDLGLPPEKRALLELAEENICYDRELHAYIGKLQEQYTNVLLSVMPLYIQEFLRVIWPEFESVFDHVIVSSEVHLIKPDPRIYQLALDCAGCRADEAVFIDDGRENVAAAQALGIQSILYESREQVIEELEMILSPNC